MITVLIPAHNEEDNLDAALSSLRRQTTQPHRIIVVADNCTDSTEWVAEQHGVEVFRTVNNRHKKAGALNQALRRCKLPYASHVLVMDADTTLDSEWLTRAVEAAQRGYDGVSGNFRGKRGGGLVGMFQRNEYARYARDVARRQGRALVLTGTASLFRVGTLMDVANHRGYDLPGVEGDVYDTEVLTEDNELTFALLHLGYRIIAPKGCVMQTEVMESWGDLWRQRLRWKRGAIENCVQYGWTKVTRAYWGRQVVGIIGVLITALYLASLSVIPLYGLNLTPFWLGIMCVFSLERMVTVRERGLLQMLIAGTLVIEFTYDVFLQAVQATAYFKALTRAERRW